MEIWRIALMAVLGWLLLGALSTIIPQSSVKVRSKLIAVSRLSLQKTLERYARQQANPDSRILRHFRSRDTDSQHLNRIYFQLVALGPLAYPFLWFAHRMRLDHSSGIR